MKLLRSDSDVLFIKQLIEMFGQMISFLVKLIKRPKKIAQITSIICLFFLIILSGCTSTHSSDITANQLSYVITNSYPHDPSAFTQGLEWDNGTTYEGTGLYGASSLRQVDYKTGEVKKKINYPKNIFAESITVFQDRIYQLTWKNMKVFVYGKPDLNLLQTLDYYREGWGITSDENYLIVSDGSATLFFLNPDTLAEIKQVLVHDNDIPVSNLNDLTYVKGNVFANVFQSDRVAIINLENGEVERWLDFSGLRKLLDIEKDAQVLNGIMYDSENNRILVTGKNWSKLFEIKLISEE